MESLSKFILTLTFISLSYYQIRDVESHGRLMEPASRNAMWRFGYPNPVDYSDNELFCGGFVVQQTLNDGKCGVCGDEWSLKAPRPHEIGGIFGNGIVVRQYYRGQDIPVEIALTANHLGKFVFRLCPQTHYNVEVTQDCLNQNVLPIVNADGTLQKYFKVTKRSRSETFILTLRLPKNITCSHCVLQWTYVTGNNWGICEDGTGEMGCGPQENFINCADIAIRPSTDIKKKNKVKLSSKLAFHSHNPYLMYFKDYSKPGAPMVPLIVRDQVCVGHGENWVPGIDTWCQYNCMKYPPVCPKDKCRCIKDCHPAEAFSKQPDAEEYCLDNCMVFPARNCTADKCICY